MKLHISDMLFAPTLVLAASIFTAAGAAPAFAAEPDHIFVIVMENHATNEIIGNTADAPFLNQLAKRYSVATNYHGVTHPSSPNYLAASSGDFQGIWDDCKAGATITCPVEEFFVGAGDATDPTFSLYTDPNPRSIKRSLRSSPRPRSRVRAPRRIGSLARQSSTGSKPGG